MLAVFMPIDFVLQEEVRQQQASSLAAREEVESQQQRMVELQTVVRSKDGDLLSVDAATRDQAQELL